MPVSIAGCQFMYISTRFYSGCLRGNSYSMRIFLFIAFLSLAGISLFGQTKYPINYGKIHKLRINSETKIGTDNLYDVDFLNENNQVIKSVKKTAEDDHHIKKGYAVYQTIRYYFYSDSLKMYSISIDLTRKIFFKTVYEYSQGKQTGWESYSIKPRISKDSFQTIIDKDLFLNYPAKFPTANLTLETKMTRKFENEKLVYKCYYERYGKLKTALPAREQFFTYNTKGQITEHISNPKSDAGGTAFMRQTFEYDDKDRLIRREWYENNKHQGTDDLEYTSGTITERKKFYDIYGNGDPRKFSTMITIYKLDNDGSYYSDDGFRTEFSICPGAE